MKRSHTPKKPNVYKSAQFVDTDSRSESEEERQVCKPRNQATDCSQSAQVSLPPAKSDLELQSLSRMSFRSKSSKETVETNPAISKKRPLSPYATTGLAKRPATRGGFSLSSDEDDVNDNDNANSSRVLPSKPASQQNVAPSKLPTSIQGAMLPGLAKGPFPTKQLNKACPNALLGRNEKLRQAARNTLSLSLATQSLQQSIDPAANLGLPNSSKNSQEFRVDGDGNKKANLSLSLGKSLLGTKRTGPLRAITKPQDAISRMDESKKPSCQENWSIVMDSLSNNLAPSVTTYPRPAHAAVSAVAPHNTYPQQHKSTLENHAAPKVANESKYKEENSKAQPRVGIEKEKRKRQFLPPLRPAMMQAPTKFRSEPRSKASLQLTTPPGVNQEFKLQDPSTAKPKTLGSRYQREENKPKPRQRAPEVHRRCTELSKPESDLSRQHSEKLIHDIDSDAAGDSTVPALKKPVMPLSSDVMALKIDHEGLKNKCAINKGSEMGSGAAAGKISLPAASEVISDVVADASSDVLVLPQPSKVSKDAQPYFEYSIFRKDWSSEQDESKASDEEIILHRFTDIHEANTQAEKLFQSSQYSSYMIVECITKQDEHGCMVLTSSIAPLEYPTHRHHTKIYVRRDGVSKFANQTPQSLRGTTFISDAGYVLRLFRLIEASGNNKSDSPDPDSDSGSTKAAASKPIRAYHPHSRPEVYTTLEAANRAAKNLQIELSHEKNPRDVMTKALQEQDLRKLNAKVLELASAGQYEDRYWQSRFNASGLGGDNLELVVEKVRIWGPRNI